MNYQLFDSGYGQKLEQFGPVTLIRPCAQAVWTPHLPEKAWERADATFTREKAYRWIVHTKLPDEWTIELEKIRFKLKATDFGHLGIFPEQAMQWAWISTLLAKRKNARVLNLFAYSGGASLAAAKAGATVCHLDASKGMVTWARENADLNGLTKAPIRWIVDDAQKFLVRCRKRGERFDAIIIDPPSFGRGKTGEMFKIERDLPLLLEHCQALLSENPLFVLLTCHTPGYTPTVLAQLLREYFPKGAIDSGEMIIPSEFVLPSGAFARWSI